MPATNDLSSGNNARGQAARLSALSRSDLVLWPIATNFAGFAQVSFLAKSRRDLLIMSI
jgi:hypothetical protein